VQEIRVIRDLMIGYDDKRFGYQALNRDKRKRDAACVPPMSASENWGLFKRYPWKDFIFLRN
jgi:hypothetical protein